MKVLLIFGCLLSLSLAQNINPRKFPKSFLLGVSSAATQIEGGAAEDGKGESIWDYFAAKYPNKFEDGSNPSIAADSYHKYKEDIALIKAMNLDMYRVSIAWTRIFPSGYKDSLNEAGVQYYKNLFKEMKDNGIQPMATLYHWDLPQNLEATMGGWMNESIADIFGEYARFCFKTFHDDVKWWVTVNEPKEVCQSGYGAGRYAPGIVSDGIGDYVCAKNLLLAHATAYHIYDKEFRKTNQGKVGMAVDGSWPEPGTDSEEDKASSERALHFAIGLYINPTVNGDWPEVVKKQVARRSTQFEKSRLPELTEEQIQFINGTSDYIGLNHYSTMLIRNKDRPINEVSFDNDISAEVFADPSWKKTDYWWFFSVPWGLRRFLNWLNVQYNNPEIFITENGYVSLSDTLDDVERINYYEGYLSATLDAIYEDNIKVVGYTAWSIIDDWEWTGGFNNKLGMYRVDFKDPNRTRTARKSADYFTRISKNRCLVDLDKCIE